MDNIYMNKWYLLIRFNHKWILDNLSSQDVRPKCTFQLRVVTLQILH